MNKRYIKLMNIKKLTRSDKIERNEKMAKEMDIKLGVYDDREENRKQNH